MILKTDPSIYEFLATGTEAFRVLSDGVTLSGSYRFVSLTLKGIERRLDGIYERFPLFTNEELRTMLPVLVPLEQTRVYQEIFAKGEAVGKAAAAAEAKGEVKGKADGLKRLLTRRFGALPRWAVLRLETAAVEQLDGWLEGIFDAQSLEGLLGPKPRRGVPKGS